MTFFWFFKNPPGYMIAMLSIATGSLTASFLYRRYTRITPGLVETLAYPLFGRGKPTITRVVLRGARVVVDLKQSTAFVDGPAGRLACIQFVDSRTRHALAHAILRAAVSTAQVPDLPDDQLLG